MKGTFLLLVSMLLLGACAHDPEENPTKGAVQQDDAMSADNISLINGEDAYNNHCAGCHETGMLGAPVAGDALDWGERSRLWDAVLLDHAITGYLEMPARGGVTEMPDEIVKAAAEYMLRMTFPDMPVDQK